jgi:hypothetical protein
MNEQTWETIKSRRFFTEPFMWFATDLNNNCGLFFAIENSPVPTQIFRSYKNYLIILQAINKLEETGTATPSTNEKGDFSGLLKYSNKGLFVFSYLDAVREKKTNTYDLIFKPGKPILLSDIQLSDDTKRHIPRIRTEFSNGNVENQKIF